ncbi:MAG TPA: ATP-binding protein [Firmicutes bacterium]|nr:ATP-binding protein [Bacillota bacterium]
MLIEFTFANYRSFRDPAVLSMEATGLGALKKSLISYKNNSLLPTVAIYGKNGGGKSNVIRAFWLAVQFIRNAQRTQHENAPIPVQPFLLNDTSAQEPTSFEFIYVLEGIKYIYGFSATRSEIVKEYLYHTPKGQRALVFDREYQNFTFRDNAEKKKRQLIGEAVGKNQLYFSVACTMNESACAKAMTWFREHIFFSRDYTDIPQQLLEYAENPNMLQAIKNYAKMADLGIQDMSFEFHSKDIDRLNAIPEQIPDELKTALTQFMKALSDAPNTSDTKLKLSEVNAISFHKGIASDGTSKLFELSLSDESDGTRRLMSLAPALERVLACGSVLLVDELDREMHPLMVELIVSKFQSPTSNPNHAQLIFTTHDTELLNTGLLRKDQLYFADKDRKDGVSSLYSIGDLSTPTNENIRKGYLLGKYGATPELPIEEVE